MHSPSQLDPITEEAFRARIKDSGWEPQREHLIPPGEEMRTLASQGAANVVRGQLPRSSHLLNPRTEEIFPWTDAFAERGDILVNCDANGNTDPAVWDVYQPQQPVHTPVTMQSHPNFPEIVGPVEVQVNNPPVTMAQTVLGSAEQIPDYRYNPVDTIAPASIPPEAVGQEVSAAVKNIFDMYS